MLVFLFAPSLMAGEEGIAGKDFVWSSPLHQKSNSEENGHESRKASTKVGQESGANV